ncbi:hypothetical protein BKA61DRAFT_578552 [Leptodontidium sp. MPI-SDFR-AT-0119]|nr:hypothetical protein BKA61DRAFT_578552 [Leptodontidium sp. MPI-SDFR-AT-0119]
MCLRYSLRYQSCEHPGKVYSFPCSFRTQCGQEVSDPRLLFFRRGFPDFCPQCLLTGGLFDSSLPNVNAADGSAINGLSNSRRSTIIYGIMEDVWERAKNDPTYTLEEDAFITENAMGASGSVVTTARKLLRLLNCSFWHTVIDRQESPSRFQRLFLIQLSQFIASSLMKSLARQHYRREAARSNVSVSRNQNGTIENPVRTQCQHIFGEHCLCAWIVEHESCPFCRRELLTLSETEDPSAVGQEVARVNQPIPIWMRRFLRIDDADAEEGLLKITGSDLLLFFTRQLAKERGIDLDNVYPDGFHIGDYDPVFLSLLNPGVYG